MSVKIDFQECNHCGVCEEICPENVFAIVDGKVEVVYEKECWYCGSCMMDCKKNAIEVVYPRYMTPVVLKAE